MEEARMKHSVSVGRKMVAIGKKRGFSNSELEELFALGYNHDIGYEFGNNKNHAKIGGMILRNSKYKYWREIYYHGDVDPPYKSVYLDILNLADMQVDKNGEDVEFEKRLKDIGERYGFQSDVYANASALVERLKNL